MDFLRIRKKAKERAEARAAEESAAAPRPDRAAAPPPHRVDGLPLDDGVVTDEDLVQGALAARLQGLAAPAEPASQAKGACFTTWRPGAGAPPLLAFEEGTATPPAAEQAAFAVVAPSVPLAPRTADSPAPAPEPVPAADPLDEFFYRADEAGPALPQIAATAAAVAEEPPLLVREEYVTFFLGPEEYAVAIERVREVIQAPPITEVPRAPAHILGVVTVRGEVVAVVDPRRRLGLAAVALDGRHWKVVIVDVGDGPCGLLVDRVASVVRLRPGSIEPCPQGIAGQRAEYLAGIGRAGDRLFTVLDLGTLLRPPGGPERGGGFAAGSSSWRAMPGDGAVRVRSDDARP